MPGQLGWAWVDAGREGVGDGEGERGAKGRGKRVCADIFFSLAAAAAEQWRGNREQLAQGEEHRGAVSPGGQGPRGEFPQETVESELGFRLEAGCLGAKPDYLRYTA